jgi:hypothetical protein
MPKNKTYKREVAVALLIWLAYVVEVKDATIVETIIWPVFTFVALAFGVDWWGKNGSKSLPSLPEGKNSLGVREPQEHER